MTGPEPGSGTTSMPADREQFRDDVHARVVMDAWGLAMLADKLKADVGGKPYGSLDEMRRRAQRLADHLSSVLNSLR